MTEQSELLAIASYMTEAECAQAYRELKAKADKAGFAIVGEWIDALAAQPRDDVRELLNQPTGAGSFVGDIFYGSDDHTTLGTHRWDGSRWEPLMDQTEALIELLRMARQERDRLRDRINAALSKQPDTDSEPSDDVRERKPVAWRYEYNVQYRNRMECTKNLAPLSILSEHRWSAEEARNYSETPLYTALATTTQDTERWSWGYSDGTPGTPEYEPPRRICNWCKTVESRCQCGSQTDDQPDIPDMTDAECATAYRDLRRRANDAGFATVGEWIDEQPETDGLAEQAAIIAWLEAEAEERGKKTQDGWALHWAADRIAASEHHDIKETTQ